MNKWFLLFPVVFIASLGFGQNPTYKLVTVHSHSDLNYQQLDSIDSYWSSMDSVKLVFEPVAGSNTVYQFMATYKGESFTGGRKKFHDILVVKTDAFNTILDAYQYTLEWAEPPCQSDVYRSSVSNLVLTDEFKLDDLKMKRTLVYEGEEEDPLLSEGGLIRLHL